MKKIFDIARNNPVSFIIFILLVMLGMVTIALSPIILLKILGFNIIGADWILIPLILLLWIFALSKIVERYDDKDTEIMSFCCIIGIFSFSIIALDNYTISASKKLVSTIPTTSYHTHVERSPNYSYHDTHSHSNYSHSEPQYISEPSDINLEEISPPSSEIGISDSWEYVTSDEQGNEYYINKNFGVYSTVTSIEGNVFSASFKQVLSNGGREVEVPAYDINKGMITEKKIVAYEENIIRFRNETGIKEFSFSTISGYTSANSIIIGYGIANVDNILKWHPINDEVYDALYNAAYKHLRR